MCCFCIFCVYGVWRCRKVVDERDILKTNAQKLNHLESKSILQLDQPHADVEDSGSDSDGMYKVQRVQTDEGIQGRLPNYDNPNYMHMDNMDSVDDMDGERNKDSEESEDSLSDGMYDNKPTDGGKM